MLTVVAKLLQIIAPTTALFGEKDYQQLVLIRQMVRDLNFDVKILAVQTVREPDGLAPIAHGASREADADESQRKGARDGAHYLLWIERHRCPSIVKYAH